MIERIGNATLHLGDCLTVLKTLQDCSVDSVVTDPPYGLSAGNSKGVADRLGDILLDVALPDLYHANAKIGRVPQFFGPLDSVSFLNFMLRAARVGPGVAVSIRPASCPHHDLPTGRGVAYVHVPLFEGLSDGRMLPSRSLRPSFVCAIRLWVCAR